MPPTGIEPAHPVLEFGQARLLCITSVYCERESTSYPRTSMAHDFPILVLGRIFSKVPKAATGILGVVIIRQFRYLTTKVDDISKGTCTFCHEELPGHKKLLDDRHKFLLMRYQPQMPTMVDMQLRTPDQALHDPRVDQWNKWIVIACQNQCRLP
jgi:hypothetical protein